MLNEAPKKPRKEKDYSNPTKWQLFWRIQWECFRRAVTPYLMYLFMSLLCLVCQTFDAEAVTPVEIALGIACILGGAFFNGHLCYHYGKMHYGAFVAGELHRRNARLGIRSGGDHRPEREYRFWKGCLIGFYVGLPVIVLGVIAGASPAIGAGGFAYYALAMFAGWAIIPITWFGTNETSGLLVSPYWSILFTLIPIAVSGVLYVIGAMRERAERERADASADEVRRMSGKGKK